MGTSSSQGILHLILKQKPKSFIIDEQNGLMKDRLFSLRKKKIVSVNVLELKNTKPPSWKKPSLKPTAVAITREKLFSEKQIQQQQQQQIRARTK